MKSNILNSLSQKKNCLSLEELLKLFPIGIFPMEIFSIEDSPTGIFIVWLPPIRTPVRVFRIKKLAVLEGGEFGVMANNITLKKKKKKATSYRGARGIVRKGCSIRAHFEKRTVYKHFFKILT